MNTGRGWHRPGYGAQETIPMRDTQSTTKRCSVCGERKPLDQFATNRQNKDGRHSYCRPCASAQRRAWRARNPERDRENQQRWRRENHDHALDHQRRYIASRREAVNAGQRRRYDANRDHARRWLNNYRAANHERFLRWGRACYARTAERRRADARAIYRRKRQDPLWVEREWFRLRQRGQVRYAAITAADEATLTYAAGLRGEPCVYCGQPADTIDHIVPLSAGGRHHWNNLAPACHVCNRAKLDHPLWLFLLRRRSG
jgi:5-methylcytosine-specific restriction endonuclease McrA